MIVSIQPPAETGWNHSRIKDKIRVYSCQFVDKFASAEILEGKDALQTRQDCGHRSTQILQIKNKKSVFSVQSVSHFMRRFEA